MFSFFSLAEFMELFKSFSLRCRKDLKDIFDSYSKPYSPNKDPLPAKTEDSETEYVPGTSTYLIPQIFKQMSKSCGWGSVWVFVSFKCMGTFRPKSQPLPHLPISKGLPKFGFTSALVLPYLRLPDFKGLWADSLQLYKMANENSDVVGNFFLAMSIFRIVPESP